MMLLGISLVANAESYIGGTLGYGLERVSVDGYSTTANAFKFALEGGHHLNDVWALGASVGADYQNLDGDGLTTVKILPYLRATFAHASIVDFFGEVAVGYGCDLMDDYTANSFNAALRPGFVVNTSSKFSLLCRTTLFSFTHYEGVTGVGFAVNTNLELGFLFKF